MIAINKLCYIPSIFKFTMQDLNQKKLIDQTLLVCDFFLYVDTYIGTLFRFSWVSTTWSCLVFSRSILYYIISLFFYTRGTSFYKTYSDLINSNHVSKTLTLSLKTIFFPTAFMQKLKKKLIRKPDNCFFEWVKIEK